MAAEEIDHFRKVARVAGDMGVDVSFVLSQPNEKRFVDSFRGIITTWEDHAVFGFLIDRSGATSLKNSMTAVTCRCSEFCRTLSPRNWAISNTAITKPAN